ncbi:MAG: type II toxin-antitoxin system VapC family toxin [Bacteroidia bacterium]
MSGRFLLDSNIVIAILSGDQIVISKANQASEIFLPSVVIGELYYGAFNSGKKQINIERIDQLRTQATVLNCDGNTAMYYGQIKKGLKEKGNPIPENDIWIAAIALQYNLNLVTRDHHFSYIEGLNVEKW